MTLLMYIYAAVAIRVLLDLVFWGLVIIAIIQVYRTGKQWKHLKSGGLYVVLHDDATREDDLEPVVVYQAVDGGRIWVRPAIEFFDGRFVPITTGDPK